MHHLQVQHLLAMLLLLQKKNSQTLELVLQHLVLIVLEQDQFYMTMLEQLLLDILLVSPQEYYGKLFQQQTVDNFLNGMVEKPNLHLYLDQEMQYSLEMFQQHHLSKLVEHLANSLRQMDQLILQLI
jgi:hypothetical protein